MDSADRVANQPVQGPAHPFAGLRPGRVVDYVEEIAGVHLPAIVTGIVSKAQGAINLCVFNEGSPDLEWYRAVDFDPHGSIPGTWHWLERED